MKTTRKLTLIASALLLSFSAYAQEAPDIKEVESTIRKNLVDRLPALPPVDEVRPTPITGIYEVRAGDGFIYTDAEANYIMQAPLFDARQNKDLTEERLDAIYKVNFEELPLDKAIKVVYGDGSRKLAVFEDPNCGYCKKLEKDLAAMGNLTLYAFIIPILGDRSVERGVQLWCSENNSLAWQKWMQQNEPPKEGAIPEGCNPKVLVENLEFAQKHNISSTPHIIFADSSRIKGYMPPAEIEKQLAKQTPAKEAKAEKAEAEKAEKAD